MKTYLLLLILVLTCIASKGIAQSDILFKRGDSYQFIVDVELEEVKIDGTSLGNKAIAPRKQNFTIVNIVNNKLVLDLWDWAPGSANYVSLNYDGRKKYFTISSEGLSDIAIRRFVLNGYRPSFVAGAAIIPIKVRFNSFDFSKDVTLGTTIGASWRISKYSEHFVNLLAGFGITSVSLDSTSTNGQIKLPSDRSALTPSLGLVFDFNGVQAGIFSGIDMISYKEQTQWMYNRKPWLSIGLGYTILSKQAAVKKPGEQSQ